MTQPLEITDKSNPPLTIPDGTLPNLNRISLLEKLPPGEPNPNSILEKTGVLPETSIQAEGSHKGEIARMSPQEADQVRRNVRNAEDNVLANLNDSKCQNWLPQVGEILGDVNGFTFSDTLMRQEAAHEFNTWVIKHNIRIPLCSVDSSTQEVDTSNGQPIAHVKKSGWSSWIDVEDDGGTKQRI